MTRRNKIDLNRAEQIAYDKIKELLSTGERVYIIPMWSVEVNGNDYRVYVMWMLNELGAVKDGGPNHYRGMRVDKK